MKLILCGFLAFAKTAVVSLKWLLKMQLCCVYGKFNFSRRIWSFYDPSLHNRRRSNPTCFCGTLCLRNLSPFPGRDLQSMSSTFICWCLPEKWQLNAVYEERRKVKRRFNKSVAMRLPGCFGGRQWTHLNTSGSIVSCGSQNLWSSSSHDVLS